MKLQRQIDQLLARQASEWHQVLENGGRRERAEFVAWLKRSPEHVREYLETVYTDRVLRHIDPERREDVDALIAQAAPEVVWISDGAHTGSRFPARHGFAQSRFRPALAAGIALFGAIGLLVYWRSAGQTFSTDIGEQRTIQLADASSVMINSDTKLRVEIDKHHRLVRIDRGEAWFEVARDVQRPFVIKTPAAEVEVLGTQFNVYARRDGARISVLEGSVRVRSSAAGKTPEEAVLRAGAAAQVKADGAIQMDPDADIARAIAWRERKLVFVDAPLEEMVYEFNRHNRTPRLRLEGVPPGTHHYNGTFNANDPESLAALLAGEPDLVVERRGDEIIISND